MPLHQLNLKIVPETFKFTSHCDVARYLVVSLTISVIKKSEERRDTCLHFDFPRPATLSLRDRLNFALESFPWPASNLVHYFSKPANEFTCKDFGMNIDP